MTYVIALLALVLAVGLMLGIDHSRRNSRRAEQVYEVHAPVRVGSMAQLYRPVSGRPLRQAHVMGIEGNKAKFIAPDGAIYSRRLGQVTLVH